MSIWAFNCALANLERFRCGMRRDSAKANDAARHRLISLLFVTLDVERLCVLYVHLPDVLMKHTGFATRALGSESEAIRCKDMLQEPQWLA